jgi:hypothetical protein
VGASSSKIPHELRPAARLNLGGQSITWSGTTERPERGQVMCIALQLLQKLVLSAEQIGEALVPYYRQARRCVCCGARMQ